MTVTIERIISQLISVRLIMGVWLVNNQVSVGIWRENVLVTIEMGQNQLKRHLLEHAQTVQLMELVVDSNDLVVFAVEAVEDHGLLVNS